MTWTLNGSLLVSRYPLAQMHTKVTNKPGREGHGFHPASEHGQKPSGAWPEIGAPDYRNPRAAPPLTQPSPDPRTSGALTEPLMQGTSS